MPRSYAQQPARRRPLIYPDNARLIEIARQAGAGGRRTGLHQQGPVHRDGAGTGRSHRREFEATPTIRINGQDYANPRTPDALVAKIKETVGNVPASTAPHLRLQPTTRARPPAPLQHPRHDRDRAQRRPAERTRG